MRSLLKCLLVLALAGVVALARPALAQEASVWIQIEARPTQALAEERAAAWAGELPDVSGYALSSGWYAIVLGPYPEPEAAERLAGLRAARAIPGDSFLADGRGFGSRFFGSAGRPGGAAAVPAPVVQPLVPAEETVAQSRAAERALSRAEREDLQRALAYEGFYTSTIDGAIGPGTRRAMSDWQRANGFEQTGVLSSTQRRDLIETYVAALRDLGIEQVEDSRAGIEIALPLGRLAPAGADAPFVKYRNPVGEERVYLISMAGDRDDLRALYAALESLALMPTEGPRRLDRQSFTMTGRNEDRVATAFATLSRDGIKGYLVVWPTGDEAARRLVSQRIEAAFRPVPGAVLPDDAGGVSLDPDAFGGLRIRRPIRTLSGVYADPAGAVLTAAAALEACGQVLLSDGTEMTVAARDAGLGVALLTPATPLAPIGVAELGARPARIDAEIAVAGYSFGGLLGAPSVTYGALAAPAGLGGESDRLLLRVDAQEGDAGGPLLAADGTVAGLLLPPQAAGARQLPEGVALAASPDALAAFLVANARPAPAPAAERRTLDPEDLARLAADITVLVECWD